MCSLVRILNALKLRVFSVIIMNDKFLRDVRSESPCGGQGWCFAEEVLRELGLPERNITQMRLIFDLKLMESKRIGKDVGKDYAKALYLKDYAVKFDKVYKEGMTHAEVFELVFQVPYPGQGSCSCQNVSASGEENFPLERLSQRVSGLGLAAACG